jgi:hypothetical protein
MRDNLYMTAILICACLLLLAGLAFTGLEILHYTQEPELPAAPPQQQQTAPAPDSGEPSPAATTKEGTGETAETPPGDTE